MRRLVFAAALLAVATVGFHTFISASLAAAREAKAATFAERFAPALELMAKQAQ
ncbi:hypothetical protein NLM33_02645 [Bradyrhizobium sp. CCGUVB1N3]|uniref:hypothetical protein n=1 Tax=Bradyrhizobium sp. CCGUVB1N3 TaxID=2949629 RepID=UPI0020B29125|nr:hypothetical protein [Bradyrhizobium sp. CCGUVB1N3]MCP3469223.1 hypothetical protein [Bradyrhizobium sp. CCGUVB1N3]